MMDMLAEIFTSQAMSSEGKHTSLPGYGLVTWDFHYSFTVYCFAESV